MTLGHGLHGGRKKRGPSAARVVAWIVGLAFIIAIGAWSYRTGSSLARQEEARLRTEVATLTETMDTLEERNTALNAALERAQTEKAEVETRYARDVPDADTARIVELVRARRAEGVPADRIAEVLHQPHTADALRERAAGLLERTYSWDAIAAATVDVYRRARS